MWNVKTKVIPVIIGTTASESANAEIPRMMMLMMMMMMIIMMMMIMIILTYCGVQDFLLFVCAADKTKFV
jgi:hypothetical protein